MMTIWPWPVEHVPDGRRDFAQRVGAVDDGCDLFGLEQIAEDLQVVEFSDEDNMPSF